MNKATARIPAQATSADAPLIASAPTTCPDGVAFCTGDPASHSDPREHVHAGPEYSMTGVYGFELMAFNLAQLDNDAPRLAFVAHGDWPELELNEVDTLIRDLGAHLDRLKAVRAQLAAALDARA
ncbi:DUF6907 domain-containing protein [Streptomyces mangrovi]|uniref:DUF6907 domain-containing protein n=1 Tax=Streptomyces mangrovi TaxID=1206892 RepID=UPI00399D15C2